MSNLPGSLPASSPVSTIHLTETGLKRLELIGGTASSTLLVGGNQPSQADFTSGPGPHELLCAAQSACTAMTMRLFAERHDWPLERVEVATSYFAGAGAGPGRFNREVAIEGPLTDVQRDRLLRVGEMCPVGGVLSGGSEISITYKLALEKARTGQAVS